MTYYCKCGGKIASGIAYINGMTSDQEPFDDGFIEGNEEEIELDYPLNFLILACVKCKKPYGADLQNTFENIHKVIKRKFAKRSRSVQEKKK